jgi:hypothetical protein
MHLTSLPHANTYAYICVTHLAIFRCLLHHICLATALSLALQFSRRGIFGSGGFQSSHYKLPSSLEEMTALTWWEAEGGAYKG